MIAIGAWRIQSRASLLASALRRGVLAVLASVSLCSVAPGPTSAAEVTTSARADFQPAPRDSIAPAPRPHNMAAWPLYVRWDFDNGALLRVYGPVSVSWKCELERAYYPVFPMTGVRQWASGRSEYRLAWPLTSFVRDPRRGYTGVHLAGPLLNYERQSNDAVQSLRVAPVFSNVREATGLRQFEIAPFMYRSEDPGSRSRVTEFGYVPLVGGHGASLYRSWSSSDEHGWNAAVLFGGKQGARTRALWVPPWFSYDRFTGANSPARSRTLLPVFSSWSSPQSTWWDFAAIYSAGHTADLTWRSLPPYFSLTRLGGADSVLRFRTLLPIYGQWRTPRREIAVAIPSLWRYRSQSTSASGAWPFYAWFRRSVSDSTSRSGGSVAWPLISWGRGNGYSALGLLPLYYRLQDGTTRTTLAPPFYGSLQRPGLDLRVAFPFYLRRWTATDSFEAITLYYHRRKGDERTQGVYPLYERLRGPGVEREFVIPLYYHRRDASGERRWVYPAWADWRSARTGERTRVIGPFVTTGGKDAHGFGIVPVFYTGSGPAGSASLVGPAFWSRSKDGGRRAMLFPLAFYSHDRQSTEFHLLPLTGYGRRADGRSQLYVLWPLYTRQKRADGSQLSTLLFWLGRDSRRGERRRTWLQPLFYYDKASAENSYFALLGGALSSYEHNGHERTLKVLFIPIRKWRE